MQCGLSAGKQKLTVILVLWSSMQVTKGTWHMRKQCVPGSLSSFPAQEPGNEAEKEAVKKTSAKMLLLILYVYSKHFCCK